MGVEHRRLGAACLLAILFHSLVLVGVGADRESPAARSLEVTLVSLPSAAAPLDARVLAPRAQTGHSASQKLHAQAARSTGLIDTAGVHDGLDLAMRAAAGLAGPASGAVATTAAADAHTRTIPTHETTGDEAEQRLLRREQPGLAPRSADENLESQLPGDRDQGRSPGINARADRSAAYLDGWRRQVERIGSANFPWAALTLGRSQKLTLEVTVRADGSVARTRVLRSSGLPMLDKAAVDILALAAPFAPFPDNLRRDTPQLSFAYDWEFLPGDTAALRVGRP